MNKIYGSFCCLNWTLLVHTCKLLGLGLGLFDQDRSWNAKEALEIWIFSNVMYCQHPSLGIPEQRHTFILQNGILFIEVQNNVMLTVYITSCKVSLIQALILF